MHLRDDADQRHPDDPGGGRPGRARATTRVRCSGALQAAIAAIPAASSVEIPAHIGTWATASSANDGAAALATEPRARSALPTPRSARGEKRTRSASGEERDDRRERRGDDPELTGRCDRDPEVVGHVAQDRRQHEHARLAREEREEEDERRRRAHAEPARSRGRGRHQDRDRFGHARSIRDADRQRDAAGTSRACGKPNRARLHSAPVTYCLAMRLEEGLVFLSDTRTNAGVDNVGTYRKLHVSRPAPDRLFVLQSAGSLATTQEVLDRIAVDLAAPGEHESLATVAAPVRGGALRGPARPRGERARTPRRSAREPRATFILGGQIGDAPPDILLVYPEGNYIRASDERPFLQIGESKYGKFLLDVAILAHVDLVTSTQDRARLDDDAPRAPTSRSARPTTPASTARGRFALDERFTADSPVLGELREVWERNILRAVAELPDVEVAELSDETAAPRVAGSSGASHVPD